MRRFFSRHMPGFLGVALAAGLAVAAVPATAQAAAPAIARSAVTLAGQPHSVPDQGVPEAHQSSDTACAGGYSKNWSGYVACNSTFTSVTTTWVQPEVSCTTTGNVSFWVGLDGDGSSTVEQTGTSVSCATGTPQYYAWWEFFPANPTNYSEPVYPGDTLVATVTYEGSDTYSLKLTDVTRGWSENTTLNAAAQNLSAEVIAEATTVSGQPTALPYFTTAEFTNTAIDGESLSAAHAQQVFMADQADNDTQPPIAYPTTLSGSGFNDFYSGGLGSAAAAAFEGSTNDDLYSYSSPGLAQTSDPMMPGTSPAIAELSNGTYEMAYQSTTGYLTLFNSGTVTTTSLPMKAGTSPAIAASGGSYQVAFQYSNGSLWTYTPSAGGVNQEQGMLAGTSPAITALSGGGYEMAFQANTGVLWTFGTNGTADLGLGMAGGTSPAIAGLTTGGYETAIQENTGFFTVYGTAGNVQTNQAMAGGTSPSITG